MKPRLLLMTLDFPPSQGGVARYLHALALHFRDRLMVIAPPQKKSHDFDSCQEYEIKRRSLTFALIWPRWLKAVWWLIVYKNDYDLLVVSHILPLGTASWLSARLTHKPYAVLLHGMDAALVQASPWKRRLGESILKKARLVIANSHSLARELQEDYGLTRVIVAYPPLSAPPASAARFNKSHGLRLLTVSRLVARKGHARVLQALSALKRQGHLKNFSYQIAGQGPELENLSALVASLGLKENVSFLNRVGDADLANLYCGADIFIMPTVAGKIDREGFGMVYIEAGFYGLPCIATDHPGVNEAVLQGETGILVPDGDLEALARAILTLSDSSLRSRLGQNARRRALSVFRPDIQFCGLLEHL